MPRTDFQKLVTVNMWMFNNLLLNKSCGMLPNDFNEFLTQTNCLVQHSTSLHFFLRALEEGNSEQSYFPPK